VDRTTELLLLLLVAAVIGIIATLMIMRRQQRDSVAGESPFAVSTEGEKICPKCGMGNMWTDRDCISCKARLPG
jgi:preprotein translocase subunit YajC